MPIDRKRRQEDDDPIDRLSTDDEMVAMSLTEGESDLDEIEERSVHGDVEDGDGGYELPPPMTESEDEDDMMPILAASDAEDQESSAPPASMYHLI